MPHTLRAAVAICFSFGVIPALALAQDQPKQTHPCLPCHPREVSRFSASAMGRSLATPSPEATHEPAATFHHDASGSTVQISWASGTMHHKIEEHGLTADYPIAYAIGAGQVGRSYLIDLGGQFFQSPAAFYTAHSEWSASPGYEAERVLDFDRSITADCLFCHAGSPRIVGSVKIAGTHSTLTPISCDRCHGDGDAHRRHPSASNIVNPATLQTRARDSVCEQCHLEGVTVVLNPGKYWWDFQPGQPLEQVESHYIYRTANGEQPALAAVSQAEQLALSACLRGSAGKLWCGTCHDPHGEPVNRKQQIEHICESCHARSQLAVNHTPAQDDCVACHMPRRQARDVTHAAITDHRIARRPGATTTTAESALVLAVWHDPAPASAQRNLGLALFNTARQHKSLTEFQHSLNLLSSLSPAQTDAPVSAAEGYMLLGSGQTAKAVDWFRAATRLSPTEAEYWLDLGVAQDAAGDSGAAIEAFRRSVSLAPYDYRPYKALAGVYQRGNQPILSQQTIADFLKLVPQSILMRLP